MAPFTWTYSKLKNFETCAKRHYHYDVIKDIVEPETEPLREGNATHKSFADRIDRKTPLPPSLAVHEALLAKIIASPGTTYAEQKFALDRNFKGVAWFGPTVWYRGIVDCSKISLDEKIATIFDWKTGKPSDDHTQLQLMAATIFHIMPKIERVKAALVFLSHDKIEPAQYVREGLTEIWSEILPRVNAMERAHQTQEYPPKPSGLCRKYCAVVSCPYHGVGA